MRTFPLLFVLVALAASVRPVRAQCTQEWDPRFHLRGTSAAVAAQVVFDDGSGPQLYVGGRFQAAGPVHAPGVARFDGTQWSALTSTDAGFGAGPDVQSLAVFDDGTGPHLYAGCTSFVVGSTIVNKICRWTGTSWAALGSGLQGISNSVVAAMLVHDDGQGGGAQLYAAGQFNGAGGTPTTGIARWSGTAWSTVGGGLPNGVRALCAFDDGGGAKLYAAGSFGARAWDGASWTDVGATIGGSVEALATWDDGAGTKLYATGAFTEIGGVTAPRIARFDGTQWSALASGPDSGTGNALLVHDDGGGAKLWLGGTFTSIGGSPFERIAAWDGAVWSTAGAGFQGSPQLLTTSVESLCAFDAGSGARLSVGGSFEASGTTVAAHVATWDGAQWAATSVGEGIPGRLHALEVFDDGTGPALYAGGSFRRAGALSTSGIARWNGTSWSAVGNGATNVGSLRAHDDGSGGALYASASGLTDANGAPITTIARWRNGAWSAVASGSNAVPGGVLAVHEDELYAGGNFQFVDPVHGLSRGVAVWDGTAWRRVGNGVGPNTGPTSNSILAFATFDAGGGPELYAAGAFTAFDGVQCNSHVARWDGSAWSAVGDLLDGDVHALAVFDDGSGARLYAGGVFRFAGTGTSVDRLARLEGSTWADGSPLGFDYRVHGLRVFDDGAGPTLFAAGGFGGAIARAGGATSPSLAPSILTLPGSPDFWNATALREFDDGSSGGPDLFVGGNFAVAGGGGSNAIASWRGCRSTASAFCFGDGTGSACPCGNASAPGAGEGCAHSLGNGGHLDATGSPSVSQDSVVLRGARMTSSTCVYIQGTTRANGGNGFVFGDGLRCAGGSVVRLGSKVNAGGASHFPGPNDPRVSVRGVVPAGSTRTYQVWFRNAASFCTGDTFNLTNGIEIAWSP